MPIESIQTYLVHPHEPGDEGRPIGGIDVPLAGKLFDTFNSVYEKSDVECDIDIAFVSNGGAQQNDCRDLVIGYLQDRSLDSGRLLANRLRQYTDKRSKQGLLVLMYGREGQDHRLVISRYPTNTGILAEENAGRLDVQFLERVFMRSAYSYKAAVYQNSSLNRFWEGRAVDKQITSRSLPTPEYWIHRFLASDFRTTSAQGTRRLARISTYLHEILEGVGRIDRISARPKSVERFVAKSNAKLDDGSEKYSDPLNQIQDQVGARITVLFRQDVEAVAELVAKHFRYVESREVEPEAVYEFSYFGRHFVSLIPDDVLEDGWDKGMIPGFFELQIKTVFQHAWSEASHDIGYKPLLGELSRQDKRALAFASAQAWGADNAFAEIVERLSNQKGGEPK